MPKYFLLTYYDDDTKTFNVVGPVSDAYDEMMTVRTVELQKEGRRVRISTSNREMDISRVPTKESQIRNAPKGYTLDPSLRW